jgi:redox-sensitive bicupin YhaK (pirin superfamily)
MFPLIYDTKKNPLELFQIWINLPKKSKFVDPYFNMLWNNSIPHINKKDDN